MWILAANQPGAGCAPRVCIGIRVGCFIGLLAATSADDERRWPSYNERLPLHDIAQILSSKVRYVHNLVALIFVSASWREVVSIWLAGCWLLVAGYEQPASHLAGHSRVTPTWQVNVAAAAFKAGNWFPVRTTTTTNKVCCCWLRHTCSDAIYIVANGHLSQASQSHSGVHFGEANLVCVCLYYVSLCATLRATFQFTRCKAIQMGRGCIWKLLCSDWTR